MVFGVGSFTQSVLSILKEDGAGWVGAYLIRDYAHYSPALEGETFLAEVHPDPTPLLREKNIDLVIPQSIDWVLADWAESFLGLGVPILSPTGEGMRLERERAFASRLCGDYGIPFPKSFVAQNRLQALNILKKHPGAYVIKNTLCSPTSPVHTIVCESVEETWSWLDRIDYAEGVFLQPYMGRREAGHIAFVTGGEIYSMVTNQEYKRAFDGNLGIVAGAPLGGLVEKDPEDKYGLARALLHPLLPWFREVNFHGPVQVTAVRTDDRWHVLEYNVRIGVTSGPMMLRMLENPLEVLSGVARDEPVEPRFRTDLNFGCCLTLAGYGYPYTQVKAPRLPVQAVGELDCDLWWNEVASDGRGGIYQEGHRLADVIALAPTLDEAIRRAYQNIARLRCAGAYYRLDIGRSLWPPGSE